jgi:thiosulfate/3-mercaptopyruvate sulfurtransferase
VGPIVSTEWLAAQLGQPGLVIADVRWVPGRPEAGPRAYREGRIHGAVRLDVESDLAGPAAPARGRHPLPAPEDLVAALARVGIGPGCHVVVYDDAAGMVAARLWWLLRWVGGPIALVLDGGIRKWAAEGRPLASGEPGTVEAVSAWTPAPRPEMVLDHAEVAAAVAAGTLLLDARTRERFRGDQEPFDPRAGHIPGAINAPYVDNLADPPVPVFRTPEELRAIYAARGVGPEAAVACYCGSGVSACHDLLALELAGFPGARLYPGSWSQWSHDASLPVAAGD